MKKFRLYMIVISLSVIVLISLNQNNLIAQRLPRTRWINGTLLRAEKDIDVYVIYSDHKYRIPNPVTFENLGFSWDKVQVIEPSEVHSIETGGFMPHTPPGSLIREKNAYTVFVVFKGKKHAIPDPQTARDLRTDDWDRYVIEWPRGVIDLIPQGEDIPKSSTWNEHRFFGGYCTWHVSMYRKIPWGGNAIEWLSNAKNVGFFTGDNPVPGSIMVTSDGKHGHVALVQLVMWDRDGKWEYFQVSEMNWGTIREGEEELGRTENFNVPTKRSFTKDKPPNPKTLLGFVY